MRTMTREQVAEKGRSLRLLPGEAQVLADPVLRKHHYRKPKPGKPGAYTWHCPVTPNEGGKPTREGAAMLDLMKPHLEAERERAAKMNQNRTLAMLRNQRGEVQYVEPELAEGAARNNGWRHAWRARGNPVERGPDGMLFRLERDEWVALGVRCLGTPLSGGSGVPRKGTQHDPDGHPWQWIAGEWRRIS